GEQAEIFLDLGRGRFAVAHEGSELPVLNLALYLRPKLEDLRIRAGRGTHNVAQRRHGQQEPNLAGTPRRSRQAERSAMGLELVLARLFVVEDGKGPLLLAA